MALTDVAVKQTKASEKLVKLSDGRGLQLWIFPDGAKRWRLAYRFGGKQQSLTLGVYPEVALKAAREGREKARRLIADGIDPNQQKKLDKLVSMETRTNTFGVIAAELIERKRREGKASRTLAKLEWLIGDTKSTLGARPIGEISVPEVLAVLRQREARGNLETARRLKMIIGEVFRYAMATGRASTDPTQALRGALMAPNVTPRAAITTAVPFGGLLRAIDSYSGRIETRIALQLIPLTFVRPGEMRQAQWAHFDLEAAQWSIPAEIMKMRRPHMVPLAPQAVALLRELHVLTGSGKFLFPSVRTTLRCMSENTINGALRRMDYSKDEMCGHGFRASASTPLNESGLWNADAIEIQLAHKDSNTVRRAYARGEYWGERVKMMTWWADKIDEMRRGGVVVPLRA